MSADESEYDEDFLDRISIAESCHYPINVQHEHYRLCAQFAQACYCESVSLPTKFTLELLEPEAWNYVKWKIGLSQKDNPPVKFDYKELRVDPESGSIATHERVLSVFIHENLMLRKIKKSLDPDVPQQPCIHESKQASPPPSPDQQP